MTMIQKLRARFSAFMHRRLALLQIVTFMALVTLVTASVRFYHHQTPDSFLPFGTYLLSLRLAVPPVVGLFSSYFLLFMGGVTLADAPKRVMSFLRNVFFQVRWMMLASCTAALSLSAAIFVHTEATPPPAYEQIVKQLLGGESDNGEIVAGQIKRLRDQGIRFGDQLDLVSRVFTERRKRNFDAKLVDGTTPRILVRALDSNHNDASWQSHPLRWHALGEAYSMWAQAAQSSVISGSDSQEWKSLRDHALKWYEKVAQAKEWRATELLKLSAEQNAGNVLYYTGNLEKAAETYEKVLQQNRNLSTAGNLMACYLTMNPPRVAEAESLGTNTREWAMAEGKGVLEASPYSSLLSTLAFAKLMQGKLPEGRGYLVEAYDVVPDVINSYNLATALILEGRGVDALRVLDRLKRPRISAESQLKHATDMEEPLYYLIRGLALPSEDLENRVAHFLCYLERPTVAGDIRGVTAEGCHGLLADSLNKVKNSPGPEASLLLIPAFEALFQHKRKAGL